MFRSVKRWLLACAAVGLLVSASPVSLAGAGTVTVTVTKNGAAVPGAFVALVGTGANKIGGVTDSTGTATFANVPDDTYAVKAAGDGTSVGAGSITVPGPATLALGVNASSNVFSPLGVFGASSLQLVSGGQPGVFYLSATAIPSLWRTVDYGGTWSPVTISTDDPVNGIDGTDSTWAVSASGYPGEVAAVVEVSGSQNSLLWYSRDFGLTWRSVALPAGSARNNARTYWSHPTAAGAPSILFFVFNGTSSNTSTDIYYAVMPTDSSSPSPVVTRMSASYQTSASDPIALASGSDAPVFAVAHTATGTVDLYKVDSTPDASDTKVTLTGVLPTVATDGSALAPSDAFQIKVGGPASGRAIGTTVAPNTVLLFSNKNDTSANAVLLTCTSSSCLATAATQFKDGGDVNSSGSLIRGGGGSCGMSRLLGDLGAAISPLGSAGTLGSCWVSINSGTLEVRGISIPQKAVAFDAGYGTGSDLVILTVHDSGAIKSARAGTSTSEGLNRPFFPNSPVTASAGTAPTSGGIAINGLSIPLVTGVAFSPQSPNHIVTSLSGGARILGSTNAGNAWFTLLDRPGQSVTWWAGAGTSSWILAGSRTAPGGDLLAGMAVASQSSFSSASTLTQVSGTTGLAMGLGGTAPSGDTVSSIAGIPGTNRAILALSRPNQDPCCAPNTGALAFIALGSNLAATITPIASTFTNSAPASVAYCPASGSAASVADKAFVAVRSFPEQASTGGIRVISTVSTAPSVQAVSGLSGDFRVIKVHCATGTIWAGRYRLSTQSPQTDVSGLMRSTDGGVTFSAIGLTGTMLRAMGNVSLLAIHPTNPKKVLAGSQAVDIIQTNDGGFTWTFLNDTITPCDPARPAKCGRHFGAQTPNALEFPGLGLNNNLMLKDGTSVGANARAGVRTDDTAVVGSGAGLYAVVTTAMNRNTLSFGATLSGGTLTLSSSPQEVLVSLSSTATSWTATADQPWLAITPASGTGTGRFTVSIVNAAGLPASGTVRGIITLTTTGATESVQQLEVILTLVASTTDPFGAFDTPADGATNVQGSIAVTGWALDDVEVTRVRILRAPVAGEAAGTLVYIGNAVLVDGARLDLLASYASLPRATRGGWGYLLLTNMLPNRGNGVFQIYAYADDADGRSVLLGTRTITCANISATAPFGAIDTPGQGELVSGSVNNFGWVLSPGATKAAPPDGGAVTVLIDGLPVGTPSGWVARSDLTSLFPQAQFSGIDHALGVFTFDTRTLSDGVHTIAWIVTDNQGMAAGIGSRYFSVLNGTALTLSPETAWASLSRAAAVEMVKVKRGPDPWAAYLPIEPNADGGVTIEAHELERIEVYLGAVVAGSLRSAIGPRALPAGSSIDVAAGTFTWQPGPGFVGTYDLVFTDGHVTRDVRIVLTPKT